MFSKIVFAVTSFTFSAFFSFPKSLLVSSTVMLMSPRQMIMFLPLASITPFWFVSALTIWHFDLNQTTALELIAKKILYR